MSNTTRGPSCTGWNATKRETCGRPARFHGVFRSRIAYDPCYGQEAFHCGLHATLRNAEDGWHYTPLDALAGKGSDHADEETAIPIAQVEALLRLLFPDHMTPIAKRQFDQVIEQHRKDSGS